MKPVWRVASAIALMAAAACGGGGDETGPTGSISVSASPASASIQQGGTGTITVTLTRGGGFADPVTVTVEGLPSGVTASVSPAQLTGTTTSATVTVTVANSVAAGTYNATIRASAAGVGAATASYSLTVTAAPDYSLSAAAVSIGQGSSGTSAITINRTNFTDAVALTLVSPPAGITGSFNPASATGTSSTLTINVAGTVATGTYNLTVQGAATGPGNKTTTVALTVTPPPDYTLSTTPATLTIAAGTNATTTVNINRTSFTGAVTLSLASPPAGITATFNPAAPTGNTSTATINVASTVTPGNYNVTIQGVAAASYVEGVEVAAAITDVRTTTVAVTVTAAASFTISASPNTLNVTAGNSGTSTVAIVRTNFTTDVALTLVNPPTGITGTFSPATLTGATLSSTLTLNVASTVAAGNYNVTVQGAGGSLTQTATVAVAVTAQSVGFTVTPTTLSIQQGGSANTTLNVARTGFTGNITPTISGNPANVTVTVNPNPITGNTATVTVAVGAGVATGTYNVVIAATGVPGNPTVTLPVTVTTAGSGGNLVWEFCANEVPLKFWRKSAGTWAEVTGTVVGNVTRFSFSASGNDAGVAFTSSSGGTAFNTFVYLAISTELGSGARVCGAPNGTVAKTFNVSGMGAGEVGTLGYGGGAASLSPGTASYNVNVAPGTYDWLAAFGTSSGFPLPTTTYTNYRIGRGEAAPGSAVSINRAGAPAFVTVPFTVTGGSAGSFYQYSESFSGANGSITSLTLDLFGTNASGNMLFLQPGDRLATDQVWFTAGSVDQNASDVRSITQYFGNTTPGSTTFALPAAVPAYTVTQPSGLWQAAGSIPADFQTQIGTATVAFVSGTVVYSITATRNWLVNASMSTSYTLAQPSLPNFLAQWTPSSPLTNTTVVLQGTNLTGSGGPTAGTIFRTSYRTQ